MADRLVAALGTAACIVILALIAYWVVIGRHERQAPAATAVPLVGPVAIENLPDASLPVDDDARLRKRWNDIEGVRRLLEQQWREHQPARMGAGYRCAACGVVLTAPCLAAQVVDGTVGRVIG